VVALGQVNRLTEEQVRAWLRRGAAAFLYLSSHHTVHKGILPIAAVARIVKEESRIPLVVDCAGETDLVGFAVAGADGVIYSGSKAVMGPVSGLVVGKGDFIRACRAQFRGIGRAFKVGKENMAGLLAAVERYFTLTAQEIDAHRRRMNDILCRGLADLPHTRVAVTPDEVRIGLDRVTLRLDSGQLGFGVQDIFDFLASQNIAARGHLLNLGELGFDCRYLTEADAHAVVRQVRAFYRSKGFLA
jgi:L-seryl-tRNA(Ser) seleniumtransferase/D-glucosaminate-6-phosphate ammonia-lyase